MAHWRNWSGTITATPTVVHRPQRTDDVVSAVRSVAEQGKRLKVRGSGHSFTGIAACDDHAMDLTDFTGLVNVDGVGHQVTVRAGTTLRELNAALDAVGLAMVNLGDIDAQTIAGAISTGTHGTGAKFGGLAAQVVGLELVLADGSLVSCSAQERPDLFAAARVGLGALGVISTVTLQCAPAFVVAAEERPDTFDAVLDDLDARIAGADHFEFYWFPHGDQVLTKSNRRLPAGHKPEPLSRVRRYVEYDLIENRLFGAACRLQRAVPASVRPLQRVIAATLSERVYSDVSHRVFVTDRKVRFVESEYAVPRAAVADVLRELRASVAGLSDPVAFPVEVRFAAADDIWLSTAYDRPTAYVSIHQFVGMPYNAYFDAFEQIAGAVGGRPHWGKLHGLDAQTLATRYPRFDDFRRVRASVDRAGVFANAYLDRVLGKV